MKSETQGANVQKETQEEKSGPTFVLPEKGVVLDKVERELIEQAMRRTNGNQSAAARLLGITRFALRYRLEKFKLV